MPSTNRTKTNALAGVLTAALLAALTGTALGQPQGRPPRPPLAGPPVQTNTPPGVEDSFGEPAEPMRAAQPVRPEVFRAAVMSLNDPDSPPELRLTDDQLAALRQIEDQFRANIAALRGPTDQPGPGAPQARRPFPPPQDGPQAGPGAPGLRPGQGRQAQPRPQQGPRPASPAAPRGPGGADPFGRGPGPGMDMIDPAGPRRDGETPPPAAPPQRPSPADLSPEVRERLEAVRRLVIVAEHDAWAVLSEPQREHVARKLDEHRAQLDRQHSEMYARRLTEQRRGPGAELPPISPEQVLERLPAELRARLDQLPPEQRDRLIQRFIERRRGSQQPAMPQPAMPQPGGPVLPRPE